MHVVSRFQRSEHFGISNFFKTFQIKEIIEVFLTFWHILHKINFRYNVILYSSMLNEKQTYIYKTLDPVGDFQFRT